MKCKIEARIAVRPGPSSLPNAMVSRGNTVSHVESFCRTHNYALEDNWNICGVNECPIGRIERAIDEARQPKGFLDYLLRFSILLLPLSLLWSLHHDWGVLVVHMTILWCLYLATLGALK